MLQNKVFIKEIFESVQGEGPYIGVNQLFIRFSSCNLHCKYCDTDFKTNLKEYSTEELINVINLYKNIHSVSLTGGEPLLETSFLKEFLPLTDKKIYLETNGTLYEELKEIINYIDIISMDIKLPSSTAMSDLFEKHKQFIRVAKQKDLFIKIVFDENITDIEIKNTIDIAKQDNLLIILQPMMNGNELNIKSDFINEVYYKYINIYNNVRLIPQVHKFINIR
ncbi:7-carboxy-7-deazaguanine synthase QueE [bacterium]|nr:7-carboxy-7-deazaguanine synthase QueE [bacterium]